MYIPKKEQIISLLIQLENDVRQGGKDWFIQDNNFPSLYLWEKQFKYLRGVMDLFADESENANLLKIYEELKIDQLAIRASANYDESKQILEEYIEKIKKTLKGDNK